MLAFTITADGNPQTTGTRWTARTNEPGDPSFLVAQSVKFRDGDGDHRGLFQTRVLNEIPQLIYDRATSAADLGLWAHFIWPTVSAESAGGRHLLVNTYDRARFTFGFHQLAAHTPNDNLILLFRELLTLPEAAIYFPDLTLKNGKVHRIDGRTLKSLEVVTNVHRPNGRFENQLVGFMSYLNPDTTAAGDVEALNAAKLMHWLLNHRSAVQASVRVAQQIMRRKVKAQAAAFNLRGKDPRLAIWVSDIRHQGRGSTDAIRAALREPTLSKQLSALGAIGAAQFDGRKRIVRDRIAKLDAERVFAGVALGDERLPLE